eukprot:224331_1
MAEEKKSCTSEKEKDEKKERIIVSSVQDEKTGFFTESPVFDEDNRTAIEKQLFNHYNSKKLNELESSPSKSSKQSLSKISKYFNKDKDNNSTDFANIEEVYKLIYEQTDSLLSFTTNNKFETAELLGNVMPHSHTQWLKRYLICKQTNEYGVRRMLWMIIQHQTVNLITNIYKLPSKIRKELDLAICYSNKHKAPDIQTVMNRIVYKTTEIGTVNNDCILTALKLRKEGYKPLLLNLANRFAPAAASHSMTECGSQEENLFKRSSVYLSLWPHKTDRIEHNPYADYDAIFENDKKGIFNSVFGKKNDKKDNIFYPMHAEYGAIYSPNVYIFRGSEFCGYPILPVKQRCVISMLAVAAKSRGGGSFNEYEVKQFENKVRTIYRVAYEHNHKALVLGALGCGIFNNPPSQVAQIFHRILMDEFQGCFQKVYFAIIWDHHSQPELIKSFVKYFPVNQKY